MAEQGKGVMLSKEEVDRIYSLPERTFWIAGKMVRGKYDEAAERFYLLTDNGQLSGKTAVVRKSDPALTADGSGIGESRADGNNDEDDSNTFLPEDDSEGDGSDKKKKLIFVACSVLLVVLLAGFFVVRPILFKDDRPTPDSEPRADSAG